MVYKYLYQSRIHCTSVSGLDMGCSLIKYLITRQLLKNFYKRQDAPLETYLIGLCFQNICSCKEANLILY